MTAASLQNGIYVFREFLPEAVASFSGREYEATADCSSFLEALGARSDRFSTVDQIHGDKVIVVDASSPFGGGAADGLVTKERDRALVIRTADCVPVFFFDPETPAVGICHCGWRGTRKGIVFRTLDIFSRQFSSHRSSIRVAMGPAICERCYEVGAEFQGYFPGLVEERKGRYFFNLRESVRRQLREAGIREASIVISDFCTSCSVDRFFSVRREGTQTGRFLSAILLKS